MNTDSDDSDSSILSSEDRELLEPPRKCIKLSTERNFKNKVLDVLSKVVAEEFVVYGNLENVPLVVISVKVIILIFHV